MTTLPADPYSTTAPRHGSDDGDAGRMQRGLAIAAKVRLKRNQQGWTVPSQSGNGSYYTTIDFCTCPDFESRAKPCKHIFAVRFAIEREEGEQLNGQTAITQEVGQDPKSSDTSGRTKYTRDWTAYNQAKTNENPNIQNMLANICEVDPIGWTGLGRN